MRSTTVKSTARLPILRRFKQFAPMAQDFSDQQLQAYLDELLPAEVMAAVEAELRKSESLRERLVALAACAKRVCMGWARFGDGIA